MKTSQSQTEDEIVRWLEFRADEYSKRDTNEDRIAEAELRSVVAGIRKGTPATWAVTRRLRQH
jgi:hypothetical protein